MNSLGQFLLLEKQRFTGNNYSDFVLVFKPAIVRQGLGGYLDVAENAWNACKLEKYLNNKDPVEAYVNAKFLAWCDFTSQGAVNNERTYIAGLVAGLSSEFIPIIPMIINAATPIEAHQITKSFKSVVNIVGGVTPLSTVMATNAAAVPVTCSNCKKRSHTIEKCWSKGGGREGQAPAWFGRRGGNRNGDGGSGRNQDVTTSMNVIALHAVASLATCDATLDNAGFPEAPDLIDGVVGQVVPTYLDSGTSNHCFTNRSDFSSYVLQLQTGQAAPVGEAGTFKILGKGTVIKEFMVGESIHRLTFSDALHTPDLHANLVSVGQLDERGYTTTFSGKKASVTNREGKGFTCLWNENRMYRIGGGATEVKMRPRPEIMATRTLEDLHRCFAHADTRTILKMDRRKLVDGLEIGSQALNGRCIGCLHGKQPALPHVHPIANGANDPGDLVCMDLWGPAPVVAQDGSHYWMIIIDAATCVRDLYFLPSKEADGTLKPLKIFWKHLETQMGQKIKCIHVDGGGEFAQSSVWKTYLEENRIIAEVTAPHSSELNGMAEHRNRTTTDNVNGGNKLGVWVLDGVMVGYLGGDSGYRILTNGGKVVAAGDVIFEHGNPHCTLANVDAPTDNDLAPPPTAIPPSTADRLATRHALHQLCKGVFLRFYRVYSRTTRCIVSR
ncbi:unnamed protein product [Mycena citricolor]|uniref:Integrase catalytic domain-containing protein n=1 Tax=Mycena citricolor TaxID=2018698 RepID=A0AAD2HNX0_9AGAR|nr:unnamed protein product [Mycena citricolor]